MESTLMLLASSDELGEFADLRVELGQIEVRDRRGRFRLRKLLFFLLVKYLVVQELLRRFWRRLPRSKVLEAFPHFLECCRQRSAGRSQNLAQQQDHEVPLPRRKRVGVVPLEKL